MEGIITASFFFQPLAPKKIVSTDVAAIEFRRNGLPIIGLEYQSRD